MLPTSERGSRKAVGEYSGRAFLEDQVGREQQLHLGGGRAALKEREGRGLEKMAGVSLGHRTTLGRGSR